jgi:hypothetical protein
MKLSAALFSAVAVAFLIQAAPVEPSKIDFPKKEISSAVIPVHESCHNQGIALDDAYLYLSCIDMKNKRALLHRMVSNRADEAFQYPTLDRLDITVGDQDHPSGMDVSGGCLWVAVAEYHPAPAKSTIKCIDLKTLQEKPDKKFEVADHIGALAAMDKQIAAFNWDAKDLYLLDYSGKLLAKGPNPGATAYQDCKFFKDDLIVCSGGASAIGGKGRLDMLEIKENDPGAWKLKKRVELNISKKMMPLTREGMAWKSDSIYFLPADSPDPVLYQYRFPEFFK